MDAGLQLDQEGKVRTSNDAGFGVPTYPVRDGDNWGQMGTWRHRCVICSCKFLRFVPICPHLSPGGERRKTQWWRGVPNVPSVPIENAQVSIGTVSVATAPAQSGFRIHGLSVSHTPVCQLPRGIRTFSLVCSFQVSVSVRTERLGVAETTRDTGHHSRFVPRSSFSPPRHAALAPMAIAAASRFIGLSPCPRARGAPDGTSADMACEWQAWADRVARSAVLTRGEPVTWGRHLRQPP